MKVPSLLRKFVFRSLLVGIVALVLVAGIDFVVGVVFATQKLSVNNNYYNNVIRDEAVVALTFDDGPDPRATPQVLEILAKHQVPATFFLLGKNVIKHPGLVQDIAQAGHEMGNHTFSHSRSVHDSKTRLELELNTTNKLIHNITGQTARLYRPPYLMDIGSDPIPDPATPNLALDWARELGYVVVGADVDSKDWEVNSGEQMIANVMTSLPEGHIVLLHDYGEGEILLKHLDELIIELKDRGYNFVTVTDILGLDATSNLVVSELMRLGATDETTFGQVSTLQTFLLMEGDYLEAVTGIFDWPTQASLINWQLKHGITGAERGMVGPKTISEIDRSLSGNYNLEYVPHLFNYPDWERKLQLFYTFTSAATNNNVPTLTRALLVLVIVRLGFIVLLSSWSKIRKTKRIARPSRGVSIIIPVYNEEENIRATIQSVLASHYKKFEIIAINDGSKDRSKNILMSLKRKYPNVITVINSTNKGKAIALNLGIQKAKYNTLITIDGDTVLHPDAIKNLVSRFTSSQVAAVAGKVQVSKPNSLLTMFQYLEYVTVQNMDKKAFGLLNSVGVVPGPIGAWRKKDVQAVGGYTNRSLVEDQDLTLALLNIGKKVVYADDARAYTEAPYSLSDLFKQRVRWIQGTIQCVWFYKWRLLGFKRWRLGWLILPNTIVFTICLSAFYPFVNGLLVVSLLTPIWKQMVGVYLAFIIADYLYSVGAFASEKENKKLLLVLPFQRLFYHLVMNAIVLKSLVDSIEGSNTLWHKVVKRGDAAAYHQAQASYQVEAATVSNSRRWW